MRFKAAFEKHVVVHPLDIIVPQKVVTKGQREGDFYRQIAASLKHVGLIEPLIVYPRGPGGYLLLEGHVRLEILKSLGVTEAKCLLSTDDEAYTYNRHVNYIPAVAQHFMLLEALKNGLTEERMTLALDVSIESIRTRRHAEWSLSRSDSGIDRQTCNTAGVLDPSKDESHPTD